eukprot:13895041-Alexandrium_andersonii.AAC.1
MTDAGRVASTLAIGSTSVKIPTGHAVANLGASNPDERNLMHPQLATAASDVAPSSQNAEQIFEQNTAAVYTAAHSANNLGTAASINADLTHAQYVSLITPCHWSLPGAHAKKRATCLARGAYRTQGVELVFRQPSQFPAAA